MKTKLTRTFLAVIVLSGFLTTSVLAAGDEATAKKLKVSITSPAAGGSVLRAYP
jgi:hypothetical protein